MPSIRDRSQKQHAPKTENVALFWAYRSASLLMGYQPARAVTRLDGAIYCMRQAVQFAKSDSLGFSFWCHDLGTMFLHRYTHGVALSDLEESIHWFSEAVSGMSEHHPRRASQFNSLATVWGRKYERTLCQDDLERGFTYSKKAILSCRPQDADSLVYLNNLGNLYALRYKKTGHLPNIDTAIALTGQVVQLSAHQPEQKLRWISNLGTMLYWRYQRTANIMDQTESMEYAQQAVRQSLSSAPGHGAILRNLADIISHSGGDLDSQTQCLRYYLEASRCNSAPVRERLRSVMKAAECLISLTRLDEASYVLCKAVCLLSVMDLESLTRSDIQYTLRAFAGLATLSASAVLQAGKGGWLALTALERGRGIMASLHLSDRDRQGGWGGGVVYSKQRTSAQSRLNGAKSM